jgi:MinD superfamily P-loop ATPase
MPEMTLSGLLRMGNSEFAINDANWMIIVIDGVGVAPEIIINRKENFNTKLDYYSKAYNEDLTLKANPNIKIIDYDFLERVETYFM